MIDWFKEIDNDSSDSSPSLCGYGDDESYLNNYVFALLVTLAIARPLLFNSSLRRFYAPLAVVVDLAIVLRLLCVILFLAYYPYDDDNSYNCAETVFAKIFYCTVMFGEMHQIYVLANILGLGQFRFGYGKLLNFTLDKCLQVVSALIVGSVVYALMLKKQNSLLSWWEMSIVVLDDLWMILVSLVQIYLIRVSRTLAAGTGNNPSDHRDGTSAVLPASDSAVLLFENLSYIQLIPSLYCLFGNILFYCGFSFLGESESVILDLEELCIFIFFMKVLLITQHASKYTVQAVPV